MLVGHDADGGVAVVMTMAMRCVPSLDFVSNAFLLLLHSFSTRDKFSISYRKNPKGIHIFFRLLLLLSLTNHIVTVIAIAFLSVKKSSDGRCCNLKLSFTSVPFSCYNEK